MPTARLVTRHQALGLILALALTGCGLPHRRAIADNLNQIDEARLRAHVASLADLGPRPIEDVEATAATVAWLREQLAQLQLEVTEEPVLFTPSGGELLAEVRRNDADPTSPTEALALPRHMANYGSRVLSSQTQSLRDRGWDVFGYSVGGGPPSEAVVAPNLLVEIPGTSAAPGIVELSAHYDTVPLCPGANDNSSGVAALLEIARLLTRHPPERTVRLCFFAGEEQGLLGSAVHVDNIVAKGEPIVGLLNLDSVGIASHEPDSQQAPIRILFVTWIPSTGDFITVVGNWDSGPLGNIFEGAAETYTPELPYYSANRIGGMFADGYRSDHANYWKAGIPAIFLTDTGEMRWDTYHKPGDLPEDLDYAFLRQVAQATAAATYELARPGS
ncbi:MAG: aminopeptidase YwaD [Pseudohongiellaceae bacterium]|jgi:aminopeptidase YwaD